MADQSGPAMAVPTTDSYHQRIAAERQRQLDVEGYTPEHDAGHAAELLAAASCYAFNARLREAYPDHEVYLNHPPQGWPWGREYWKPGTPERMHEKAGALALAAIDAMAASQAR